MRRDPPAPRRDPVPEAGVRWYRLDGPDGLSVTVEAPVGFDMTVAEERIGVMAKLGVVGMRHDQEAADCPEHVWEYTFQAWYLDWAEDAMCSRCGARRSQVEKQ